MEWSDPRPTLCPNPGQGCPVGTTAPSPHLCRCPVHLAGSAKTWAQLAYLASHGQLNSSLAHSRTVSLTMNFDVQWKRPRSKLTLIKSSQPTLHNTVISKFGQASHTARLAQQGMSQSTKGNPDRRRFQFEMSRWEG